MLYSTLAFPLLVPSRPFPLQTPSSLQQTMGVPVENIWRALDWGRLSYAILKKLTFQVLQRKDPVRSRENIVHHSYEPGSRLFYITILLMWEMVQYTEELRVWTKADHISLKQMLRCNELVDSLHKHQEYKLKTTTLIKSVYIKYLYMITECLRVLYCPEEPVPFIIKEGEVLKTPNAKVQK